MNKTSGQQQRVINTYNPGVNKKNNAVAMNKRPPCTHCGVVGHIIEKCYELNGYPPGYKPRSKNTSSVNQAISLLSNNKSEVSKSSIKFNSECNVSLSCLFPLQKSSTRNC